MCLGGDLKEFLTTLDGVHDVLKYQENADEVDHEAAFICTTCDSCIQLDFSTDRPAVAYLLVGSLRALAERLYSTQVEIEVAKDEQDVRNFRYIAETFGLALYVWNNIDFHQITTTILESEQ